MNDIVCCFLSLSRHRGVDKRVCPFTRPYLYVCHVPHTHTHTAGQGVDAGVKRVKDC
jgi:rhodanese-related sulfurtransferase